MNGHYETISIMVYLIKVNFQTLHWKVLAIPKKIISHDSLLTKNVNMKNKTTMINNK